MWPRLTPEAVVHEALRAAGIEPSSGWSEHDLALLDEANALIGPPVMKRRRRRPTPGLDENLERTLSSLGQLPACPSCGSELSFSAGRWQCGQPMCQKTWRTAQVMSPEAFQQVREIAERVAETHHGPGAAKAGRRDLRPRHRRRSPGPDPHAMAHARPSLPDRVDDPGRRPRPGETPLVGHAAGPPYVPWPLLKFPTGPSS